MNIGDIVGEYIHLKPLTEGFVGRCPFCLYHEQQLVVIPQLNTYECLHCGQKGGALDFIKSIETIIKWEYKRSLKRAPKHTIGTVYVLKLQGDHYYVGFTRDLPHRLAKHFAHKGALWTQKHEPVNLVDVYYDVPEFVEHRVTKIYIERYGPEKVRGGNHLDSRDTPREYLRYPKRFYYKRGPKPISLNMKQAS